jgi:predicted dehydrogenase
MTATNGQLRAGLIGCGRIGSGLDDPWFDEHLQDESWRERPCTHAGHLSAHPDFELVAGADLDPERRAAFARRWGVERVYPDHRAMLENERLDIVCVATRGVDHHRPTIDAARAGVKGILLEKHLAASLAEGDEILAVCAERGVRLVMNHTFRLEPSVRRAQEQVASGLIGELRTIVCHFGPRIVHGGTHFFDLCRFFAGDAVAVFGQVEGDPTQDPGGSGYIRFENGVRALFDARPKVAPAYLDLLGTTGLLRIGNDAGVTIERWRLPEPSGVVDAYYQPRLVQEPFAGTDPELDRVGHIRRGRNVTRLVYDELAACVREGRESIVSGRDALAALEVAMAVIESDQSGRLERLPLANRTRYVEAI